MLLSFDCETTGIDLNHGVQPFLVTTCDVEGNNLFWEWDVDPLTRMPIIPRSEKREIRKRLAEAKTLIAHNPKFDVKALCTIDIDLTPRWSDIKDTLLASHIIASNQPHDLTTLSLVHLGVNIAPFETTMKEYVQEARRIAKSEFPSWRIAKAGDPTMPSAKESVWKFDMWLLRAIAKEKGYAADHPWWTCVSEYANADSAVTINLYNELVRQLGERDLEKIYAFRLKLLPVIYGIEDYGVTLSRERTEEMMIRLEEEARDCHEKCLELADHEIDSLPVNGSSNALKKVIFDKFKLVSNKVTEKGNASLDKSVLDFWIETLHPNSKEYQFILNLRKYRKRKTAISYIDSYHKFWLPIEGSDFMRMYQSMNSTGTDTLRFSVSNPNLQQISKQEEVNLRYCFGPAEGREWWSMDAKNIELRLPAYESGEAELIKLFESPDEAPYYGSTHLLNFHTVYDDLWEKELDELTASLQKTDADDPLEEAWAKIGPHCKKKFASTWYQWCKNGGFAVQYGAIELHGNEMGTADRAFHKKGAHALLKSRFGRLEKLNQKCICIAKDLGLIWTMPDRTIDPRQGYPLLCTRSNWGKILETVPLNYHIQGTAMWVMCRMMVATHAWLERYNEGKLPEDRAYLVMQIHDEIVLDFPARKKYGNLPRLRHLKRELDQIGNDLIPAVPLPMGLEYHPVSWAEGKTFA